MRSTQLLREVLISALPVAAALILCSPGASLSQVQSGLAPSRPSTASANAGGPSQVDPLTREKLNGKEGARAAFVRAVITVYGVAVPCCGYNVEIGLRSLRSIVNYRYNLKYGRAIVDFAPGVRVGVEQIRAGVRRGGFAPGPIRVSTIEPDPPGALKDGSGPPSLESSAPK